MMIASEIVKSQSDFELAMRYYNSKEYSKAEVLFERLYKERDAKYYFDYYLDCLIKEGKYKLAKKRIKRELRNDSRDVSFYVDLGYVQKEMGDYEGAQKSYKLAYKKLPADINIISTTGNSFFRYKEYEWAEKIFKKGESIYPGHFLMALVSVYAYERKYKEMINAYLMYLRMNPRQLGFVERSLKSYMRYDVNNEFSGILEQELIRNAQKKRGDLDFELLIWFYEEKTEFSKALLYAEVLDRRNKENGVRVYRVGQRAMANKSYEVAQEAFEYVVNKGSYYPYYVKSRFLMLRVMYERVISGSYKSEKDIKLVENNYLAMIKEMGISVKTVNLIVELAHLESFYMNESAKADSLLISALRIKGLRGDMKSKLMIELGDSYVMSGNVWEAILVYGRIERFYPAMQISDDAKFKKAMCYFYEGMIDYAKDQFDVLKGSPTKLICNDAIYWSTFIMENKVDSSYKALKKYAKAELLRKEKRYDDAIKECDSIIKEYGGQTIAGSAYYLVYEIYYAGGDYDKALAALKKRVSEYSYSMWTDEAIYELGVLYEEKIGDNEKAKKLYEELLFDFRASVYSDKARNRLKKLLKRGS